MRRRFFGFKALCLVTLLGMALAFQLSAQNKPKTPKVSNVQGSVQSMDKSKMTISVKTSSVQRDVVYSADTKFLMGHSNNNKPGTVDDIKENFYISCSGTYPAGKVQLAATTCVYRATK
jgi:hypothetical protein